MLNKKLSKTECFPMMVSINTILNHKTKTYFTQFDKNILKARTLFLINYIIDVDFQ